jgi:prepilin-type N-terminal cleavage/methylation domain-containing protein
VQERGFTLLELIVVIFIVSLVMAISYPSLSRGAAALQLRSAGRDVLNTFRFAREKAIAEQAVMLLTIDKGTQELMISDSLGENVRRFILSGGVKIGSMTQSEHEVLDGPLTVRFYPDGSTKNAQVVLASETGSLLRVVSDPFSGGARIESAQGE